MRGLREACFFSNFGTVRDFCRPLSKNPRWEKNAGQRSETHARIVLLCARHRQSDKRAPTGIELTVSDLKVIQLAENYPIGRKEYGPEFLFNLRHLHVRSKLPWAILRIRDEVFHRFTEFLRNEGYCGPTLQSCSRSIARTAPSCSKQITLAIPCT